MMGEHILPVLSLTRQGLHRSIRHAVWFLGGLLLPGCSGRPVDADLVIEHVTLIDGTDAPPRADMSSVAIKGEQTLANRP